MQNLANGKRETEKVRRQLYSLPMRRSLIIVLLAAVAAGPAAVAGAQSGKKPVQKTASKPAPKPPAPKAPPPAKPTLAPADDTCPQMLGTGVGSRLQFCDVMTGRTLADGVIVHLPPHKGDLTLSFDLHNRHTYSDQEVKSGKGFASYTATVAAVAPDNSVLGRGVVQSDFRTSRDLLDRIAGGAGPRGVKAVAPVGTERIKIQVPQDVEEVSLLGEKLSVVRFEGTESFTFSGPPRPIALVSNVNVEYVPGKKPPPPKTPAKKPAPKKK
jgi:hypothetical protein